jgi:hypothetical protein
VLTAISFPFVVGLKFHFKVNIINHVITVELQLIKFSCDRAG